MDKIIFRDNKGPLLGATNMQPVVASSAPPVPDPVMVTPAPTPPSAWAQAPFLPPHVSHIPEPTVPVPPATAPPTPRPERMTMFGKGESTKDAEALYQRGIATLRDLIAPPAIKFSPNTMQIGSVVARTFFVVAYPRFLSTNWFSPIINIEFSMDTALFIHPIDTADIMKNLRKSATQVQSRIHMETEDGKIRDPMLETALADIESLRDNLQQGTEKFFRFGLYMTVYGKDDSDLNDKCHTIESILEAQLVYIKPAILRMDQGFAATRPLANDVLDVANNLNTEPLSTTFPFVSSDLSSNEGVLYGINRHNNSLILFDRFKMENANMVVFAKSGAGKSYTVKLEVLRSMMFGASVIIIDPENEYKHLCEAVGGSFLKISLNSEVHLNPFDLPKQVDDEDSEGIYRNSVANLIGLLHLMLGSVTPEEDSILDRGIRETYAIRDITETSDFSQLDAASFPTMSDLYSVLQNMEGAESLSARLERYTDGIFGGFLDKQTNIEMKNQLVAFNIRDLEEELRPIAMYIILQFIWNEIRTNMKKRVIVVDEAWVMMQHEDAAAFLFGIAKRCRKYFTGLTTITQDISDFMSSRYGKPIITNSSLQLLLRQSPSSIDLIAETFFLTDHEKFLLLESNVGEGIFFAGTKHAAIKIVASYSEDQIITSDPRQLLEIEEAKRDFDAGN
jgi:conjugal transfer ATP-binding protein TraC